MSKRKRGSNITVTFVYDLHMREKREGCSQHLSVQEKTLLLAVKMTQKVQTNPKYLMQYARADRILRR